MFAHGQSQMYATGASTCRTARGSSLFNCNSCQQWQSRQSQPCALYDVGEVGSRAHKPHFGVGLTRHSDTMVEAGTFDRAFYTKLDAYYGQYGNYCTRLAALGAANRYLSNSAKALKANDATNAVREAEKAAVALDADKSPEGQAVADSVDKVAENMSKAINGLLNQTKQNNKQAKQASKKVEEGLQKLENGDLVAAGNKMTEVAKSLNKIGSSNNDTTTMRAAENVQQLGNSLKEAAKNMTASQNSIAAERINMANAEKQVASIVNSNVKSALENNARKAVSDVVEAVVNGQTPPKNALVPPTFAPGATGATTAKLSASSGGAISPNSPKDLLVGQAVRSLNNSGAAGPVEPQQTMNTRALYPVVPPTAPGVRAEKMSSSYCMAGCGADRPRPQMSHPERHLAAIQNIYDQFGNTSCTSCQPRMYRDSNNANVPQTTTTNSNASADPLSQWTRPQAKQQFPVLVAEFGTPDRVVNEARGEVVWFNRGIFSKIVLSDVAIPHGDHVDFLTFAIDGIDLPLEGIDELARLSDSIWYDAQTDTLYARCHFSGANVASLIVAIDLAHDDDMTLEEAKEALPKLVEQSKDPQRYAEMLQMLSADVQAARMFKANKPNAP